MKAAIPPGVSADLAELVVWVLHAFEWLSDLTDFFLGRVVIPPRLSAAELPSGLDGQGPSSRYVCRV